MLSLSEVSPSNANNHLNGADISSSFQNIEPISFASRRQHEGIKREKEVFTTIHKELCAVSKDLTARHEKIQEESKKMLHLKQTFQEERLLLEKRERAIKKDVQTMVALALKQKYIELEQGTKVILKKYEDALDQLAKENKRLQVSLRDMVSTNRLLRDQNKKQFQEGKKWKLMPR